MISIFGFMLSVWWNNDQALIHAKENDFMGQRTTSSCWYETNCSCDWSNIRNGKFLLNIKSLLQNFYYICTCHWFGAKDASIQNLSLWWMNVFLCSKSHQKSPGHLCFADIFMFSCQVGVWSLAFFNSLKSYIVNWS